MSATSVSSAAVGVRELVAEIAATRLLSGIELLDLLSVVSCGEHGCCQLLFAEGGKAEVESAILPIPSSDELNELQQCTVEEFGAWFVSWSRNLIAPKTGQRALFVKIDEAQSWLLRVPLTLF